MKKYYWLILIGLFTAILFLANRGGEEENAVAVVPQTGQQTAAVYSPLAVSNHEATTQTTPAPQATNKPFVAKIRLVPTVK